MRRRQELIDKLQSIFRDRNSDKRLYHTMLSIIKDKVPVGKFAEFYNGYSDIRVRDEELYWILKAYNKTVKELGATDYVEPLSHNVYFTMIEINKAESYTIDTKSESEDVFVIDNVMKVGNDEYICYKADYKMISDALEKGITVYNYDTQRKPETIYSHVVDDIVYRPKIYAKTISEIYEDMVENNFIPNMITWNILKTGSEQFVYDKAKKQLVFKRDEGSQINMIDGFHRTLAINKVMTEYPNFNGHMQIKIFNFDVSKAKKYIQQEAKGNKISERRLKQLNVTPYTRMSEYINNYGDSETNLLYQRIAKDKMEVVSAYNKKYLVYNQSFATALEINYSDMVGKDMRVYNYIRKWIVEFFNELLSIIDSTDSDEDNKHIIINNNVFTLYTTWSRILYKDKNWKEKLHNVFYSVDWSKENEDWKTYQVTSSKSEKRIQSKIMKLAEEYFNKYNGGEINGE